MGAERMSERSAKKIVTRFQCPFKYCRICAITRSRLSFTQWIVVTSRGMIVPSKP
jgi:hypothetical protein